MPRFEFNTRSRRLKRYAGIAVGRPFMGPQVVSLETTHHCNLACSFCESHGFFLDQPITKSRTYIGGRRKMDLATIQRVVGELAEVGTDLVELSGKGDPIAHPELTDIVKAIKDAGLGCALVTNATMAKPDLAPTLIERGLDRLNVSLNAGSRESYLASNHKDLWDKAVAFLATVVKLKKEAGVSNPWIRISHVVSKENVFDVDNMVQICADLGVDEVCWYVMGELEGTHHLQLDESEVSRIVGSVDRYSKILDDAGVTHAFPAYAKDLAQRTSEGAPEQNNPLQKKLPCYEGWMFCVISPDGQVMPCCYCEESVLGNINDKSFGEIWFGDEYKQFRKDSLNIPKTGRWICKECFTSCNRAMENQRIYNKIHPLGKVPTEAGDVPATSVETSE